MPESRFTVQDTAITGIKVVTRTRMGDHRGFLSRLYCRDELAEAGFASPIAQINQTLTCQRGAIRGMHYQYPPHAEDKFVTVLRGAVLDVAVDLRAGSPTLRCWHGEELTADNNRSLFIPKGCAHGFQTLTENCELLYLHTDFYAAASERAVSAFDPTIGIEWPLEPTDMSARDRSHAFLPPDFTGIDL